MLSQRAICSKYTKIFCYLLIIYNLNVIYSQLHDEHEFRCLNGETILPEEKCDGKYDCKDGSDETEILCAQSLTTETNIVVASNTTDEHDEHEFRCLNGETILPEEKCDGKYDCKDGSDETEILCAQSLTTETNIVVASNTTESSMPTLQNSTVGCTTEDIPHLYFILNDKNLSPGELVGSSATITYRCDPQHFLEGELYNFCLLNRWQFTHPTCAKYCPYAHLKAVTFQVDCYYNHSRISCDESLKPGTIAKISCQFGYRKPHNFPETLQCGNDGRWDLNPPRCVQSCGEEPVKITPFIGGGKTINQASFPWQVAIYSRLERSDYQQICLGTILNAKVVLSAAHCFYNDSKRELNDRQYYTVAAGKSFRSYSSEDFAQFVNISYIYVPVHFEGVHLKLSNDMAIIILDAYLNFNNNIKPACIQWKYFSDKFVETGMTGQVAGWGINTSSEALQVLDLKTLSHKDCVETIKTGWSPTRDKFCVRNPIGAVCKGNSGGGFLVPETLENKKRYYIWGIGSHGGVTQAFSCMDNSITTFTNIQFFRHEIEEYLEKYNPK